MINEIYINGILITTEFPKKQFKSGFDIRCTVCKNLISRSWFDNNVLRVPYECKLCVMTTKNPMKDATTAQKHSKILNSDEYRSKLSRACAGQKNGFYGKTHTPTSVNRIKHAFKEWKNNLTNEEYVNWTESMSVGQHKANLNNPVHYKNIKSLAARESHKIQFKKHKLNKIEQLVMDYLTKESTVLYKSSVILGHYQFDFGCKETRILLEVDGDYWHGNPEFFNAAGSDGKRQLNEIQIQKQAQDKEKTQWAYSHNFKLVRVWETEILNGSFIEKLKEVL